MDWTNWHKLYDAGLGLSARLQLVRAQIQAALHESPPGPVKIISVCAGDGRDVIDSLSGHPRRRDVVASLIDNHAPSLERGRLAALEAGLGDQMEFVCADATRSDSYRDIAPAGLVIISGVLGHVSAEWIPRFMGSLPMLCQGGGYVIWNRHLVVNHGAEHVRLIQESLAVSGFEVVHHETTSGTGFAVARARYCGEPQPLEPGRVIFEFTGLDRLLQGSEAGGEAAAANEWSLGAGMAEHTASESQSDDWAGESIPVCFERQARLHPERKALGSGSWQPTYAELNEATDRLATVMRSRGGTAGDRIALLMRHDTPVIAALLAVLKAGRVVVVLNPTDPPARLGQLLADAEPIILLSDDSHRELAGQIVSGPCRVLLYEEEVSRASAGVPAMAVSPDAPAVLIYTSGSTGPPKGVMQSQASIVHKALRVSRGLELRAEERIILLGALSGGQGMNTTFCALLQGATLCPFPIMNIGVTGLADWLAAHGITVFVSAASVFRHFVRTLEEDRNFPRIRLVWLASEPATSDDVRSCRKHFADDCVLFHTLASSETGVITQWRVTPSESVPEGRLPVGRAADGIELLLLDESGREVPLGKTGEIAIRSRHLSTGYWRNDALTARRFSEKTGPGGIRVFRSGDRGRMTDGGLLMFMGRRDTRVNVHGYRVELSEIEEALSRLPAVEKGVVAMHQKPSGDEQVAAYVMVRPGHAASAEALRDGLRAVLPGHMIPTAFVFLESFPLTPHGKVDRDAVRLISPPARERTPADEPSTVTEKLLAEIWSSVFECGPAGRQDDFFDLGGDSLTAAVMAAKIYAVLRVQIDLRVFADHSTLASLASLLDVRLAAGTAESYFPLVRVSRAEPLPLSFHQERVWKQCESAGEESGYGSAGRQLISGPLDVGLLRDSLTFLVSRHEILRTFFPTVDGSAVQMVHPPAPVELPLIDVSDAPDPEAEAARIFEEAARRSINLARGPVLRFMLVRLRDDGHQFFRITHHIICDAWSWNNFFRELGVVYEAKLRGEEPALSDRTPLQYGDYAAWQRRFMQPGGSAYRGEVAWWRNKLSDPPPLPVLPFRRPAIVADMDPGDGSHREDLDPAISRRLRHLGREINATYYAVVLAATVALLARDTGRRDLVLGTYVTNRMRVETQEMFGFFANLVALRFRVDDSLTSRDWISKVAAIAAEFQTRAEIPYEKLCEELRSQGAAVPEVCFIFSSSSREEVIRFGGLELTRIVSRRTRMPWGFEIHFYQSGARDECRVHFDAGIHAPDGVRDFVGRLLRFLDKASLNPDATLAELLAATGVSGTASGREISSARGEWQPAPPWADVEQSIAACFEAVAVAHESKKAIGSGSWQPTYGQLNAAANGIARRLLTGGDPGDRVAILMKHDGPVLAAMLAVLKAGRIVVALQAGAPPARSARIWEDARPAAIITDAAHRAAAESLAGGSSAVICFEPALADDAVANPVAGIAPDACAFLIYTSGSSGRPKAVMQSHRNILHAVGNYVRELRLVPKDRICLLGSLSGGQGVMTAHCSLLSGAVLYPYDLGARGVSALAGWIAVRKISVFIAASSVFRQLAKSVPDGATFPHLRLVRLGAEAALRSDLEAFRRICPATGEFVHVFSSSETCNIALFRLPPGCDPGDGAIPVGRPLEGKTVLLLGEDGSEAGPGESGEIAVRSRYLSPGYWGDPVRTEAVFQNVPGSDERIFRTGDMGRWRDDGSLMHLGRADDRRKVMGNRFELGEVEAALRDQPGMLNGVVALAGADSPGGLLIAWVVARRPGDFDCDVLARDLQKLLPAYMIPARFILVDSIPTAPNGKPDRQRLLQQTELADSAPAVPPRTELERIVAAAWPRVVPHRAPGVYDNFFESGGDSLRAVDFILELSRTLGRKIPPRALIEQPTISQLAEAIETGCLSGEGQPWLRPWKASLVSLREGGEGNPLLFLPGGYMSEGELLVFAGLVPCLDGDHPALGVRLNLHARRVIPPLTLGGMARAIGQSCLAALGRRIPVVIGECQACPLACEVARWLERKLGRAPDLVLLDPWHPRVEPSRDAPHPRGIQRYQRLLARAGLQAYAGRSHVICTEESGRLSVCRDWWDARIGPGCRMWEVPGGHHTYLRQHQKSLVKVINDILNETH